MKYNFKNIAFFATAILAMGAFTACSNEIENIDEPQKETKTITFTATLGEDNSLSRTSYEEVAEGNGIKLKTKWNNEDKLYIGLVNTISGGEGKYDIENPESGFSTATITDITNEGKTATFSITINDNWQEGQQLNVLYGEKNKLSIFKKNNFATITINGSENRTVGDNFLNYHLGKYDFMSASTIYSNGTLGDFTLKHETSVIKFTLKDLDKGDEIKYFEIKSTDNTNIFATRAYLNNDNGYKTASAESSTFNTNESYTSIKESDGLWYVYLVIPPTKLTEGKNITITAKDNMSEMYTATLYGLSAFEAGKIYTTPTITMKKQETTVQ
ncbi:fimbrillin family protein [Bacteroides caecigallinarum]|uniref:hypothetical protein n=1 Tax=Bacteroides caecigallinarum TaxID=1411144 RepID=UPI001F42D4F1|nr:hypothetical protein [Bacteroides caecigallinarum]MCF2593703.1 fimbrillin family protein [Bacteroides caecigallinarum]